MLLCIVFHVIDIIPFHLKKKIFAIDRFKCIYSNCTASSDHVDYVCFLDKMLIQAIKTSISAGLID